MKKTFEIGDFVVGYEPETAYGIIISPRDPEGRVLVYWLDGNCSERIKEPLDSLEQCWREWITGVREGGDLVFGDMP
jgi:hypothetical protein